MTEDTATWYLSLLLFTSNGIRSCCCSLSKKWRKNGERKGEHQLLMGRRRIVAKGRRRAVAVVELLFWSLDILGDEVVKKGTRPVTRLERHRPKTQSNRTTWISLDKFFVHVHLVIARTIGRGERRQGGGNVTWSGCLSSSSPSRTFDMFCSVFSPPSLCPKTGGWRESY